MVRPQHCHAKPAEKDMQKFCQLFIVGCDHNVREIFSATIASASTPDVVTAAFAPRLQ